MDANNLKEIKLELKRFNKAFKACEQRSERNLGWKSSQGNYMMGVGEFSGTKESGALKRAAMDLKRCLTENT